MPPNLLHYIQLFENVTVIFKSVEEYIEILKTLLNFFLTFKNLLKNFMNIHNILKNYSFLKIYGYMSLTHISIEREKDNDG